MNSTRLGTFALLLALSTTAAAGTVSPVVRDVLQGFAATPAGARVGRETSLPGVPTTCAPGDDAACDDGNVCTEDRCDPVRGCISEPIAGTCWRLRGRTTFIATALGHTCTCTQSAGSSALALKNDGSYAADGGTCPRTQQPLTDEVGTSHAQGRRLVLQIENLGDVLGSAQDCVGGPDVNVTGYRTWVRQSADGSRLRGTHSARVHAVGSPVSVTTVTHFVGQPGDGNVPGGTPPMRCVANLTSCLQNAIRH